jgi:hypothetical protein
MKKSIPFLIFIIFALLSSCASTKSAKENSPAGNWDYAIKGTPEGDFTGIMTITKTETGYTGQMTTSQGTLPFKSTKFISAENRLEAEFEYGGMGVFLIGIIAGTTMTGTVDTQGYEFPLTANKKN